MSNKVKFIDIKNHKCSFFDGIINIKKSGYKIDEKPYKNIFIYFIGYVTIKDSKYVKINSVIHLYLIFSKFNEYFEEINKYLTLVPTNESKKLIKNIKKLWSKIRDLIRSIAKNSEYCDEKYMKIKFDSDDDLPVNKTLEIHNATIVFRAAFHK